MTLTKQQHYEVAIVGGGIAGVTLALMLEKLHISYILLEARDTLESDRGAGIGLQPNGMRILDQLGLVEEIEDATVPLHTWFSYDAEGNLMSASSAMGLYRERIGYPVSFIERRKLLPIMVRRLQRMECVRTSARVASIEETDDHVLVTTYDGLSVTADMVVGADGVRSVVRRHIDASSPEDKIHSEEDISVGFSTVYGMSAPTEGIAAGERFAVYRENETVIGFTGKDGIVFWFVFENLNKVVPLSQAPRYTAADAEDLCQAVVQVRVTPRLLFGDLFKNRVVAVKIPTEEGVARRWHTGRAVLVGDAACKMTPAGGQGANQAIECCAVLVNRLMEARKACSPGERLSREAIASAIASYARTREQASAVQLERSQIVLNALFCIPGSVAVSVKDMLKLSDEEWLLRAFTALSTAPVVENMELTARGKLYDKAVREAQAEMERRRATARSRASVVEQKREDGLSAGVRVSKETATTSGEVKDLVSPVQAVNGLVKVA